MISMTNAGEWMDKVCDRCLAALESPENDDLPVDDILCDKCKLRLLQWMADMCRAAKDSLDEP